ncbi:MAG TPA: AMP-binding protein, partial [Acidimicrobiales bacterium]|nr:AMP-binding protein [Acidimicrobiales bacterium]
MLLHDLVDHGATASPAAPAVSLGGTTMTFGELSARVAKVAAVIDALTDPGDRVAIIGENSLPWVECYYGVPRVGRVLVFLNHRLAPAGLADIVARSGATLVIQATSSLEQLVAGAGSIPAVRTILDPARYEALVQQATPIPPRVGRAGDPAWIIYTSGTTGSPKGATLTHASLLAAVDVTAACRPVARDEVYLFPFPLCHVAGYNLLNHHRHGRPVVLLPRFDPADFVEAAARYQATTTSLAATMLDSLLDHLDRHGGVLPSLRSVAYGAAPMPPTLLARADSELGVELAQGYGMTELSGNAVFLDPEAHRHGLAGETRLLGAAGRPGPGVAVRLVDEDERDVPAGEVGEIVVRGPQVMARYWDDEPATTDAMRGGWFHTGDVGRFDDDGLLYVVDRKKDIIVTGGENVASREVESVLHAHPAVRDVAVIGVADPRWGENVCAVVVPQEGRTLREAEMVQLVRSRLAGFKAPRHIVEVERLPTNASGKVLKAELRRWLADHPE